MDPTIIIGLVLGVLTALFGLYKAIKALIDYLKKREARKTQQNNLPWNERDIQ